jgi:hypothetical protein
MEKGMPPSWQNFKQLLMLFGRRNGQLQDYIPIPWLEPIVWWVCEELGRNLVESSVSRISGLKVCG